MNDHLSAKIKIAYVLPSLDMGGAERFIVDLILNLDREIFAPHLFLFKRGGGWAAELTAENIPVTILKKRAKFDPVNFYALYSALRRFQPTIVHTELGGDLYGRLIGEILRSPIILTTEQNVNPDESFLNNLFKRVLSRSADKIVAISGAVKDDLIKRYNIDPAQIKLIFNGLEIDKFLNPAKDRTILRDNSEIIFGTLGRLAPQKGQSVLIEAWSKISRPGLRCLIGGEGKLAMALDKQIKAAALTDRVKLIGPVADTSAYFNSLDVFVLPSIWEGLGNVLLEAGLSGLPIIASDVDGIKEIIDETTGWLVPAGNASALAEKIDWLAANLHSPLVKAKTQTLREKIIANFDIKIIALAYQSLYRELLASKKPL